MRLMAREVAVVWAEPTDSPRPLLTQEKATAQSHRTILNDRPETRSERDSILGLGLVPPSLSKVSGGLWIG